MLRQTRMAHERGRDPFRWRGGEVSRVEGFSDAVFGFALTLLVVSLEVPRSFEQLMQTMRGFLAFAMCFFMLLMVWERHYRYFRRFGFQDATVMLLNGLLLFVVLLYVYPLKFVMTLFVDSLVFHESALTATPGQGRTLFVVYGVGFAAVWLVYSALYHVARGRAAELELDDLERQLVGDELLRNYLLAAVGALSIVAALILPAGLAGLAGFVYCLVGLVEWRHGERTARRLRAAGR
jgi:uncharacterized membrane protein